ncbi:hypothetical protein Hanom_Chr08g00725071 [Helianthus anomalus]
MATRTRSHSGDSPSSFVNQNLISHPGKEVCSFNNADIAALRNSGAFPDKAIIRPFDRSIRSDVSSNEWICFLAYQFSLALQYPFPEFIMEFFEPPDSVSPKQCPWSGGYSLLSTRSRPFTSQTFVLKTF